MRYKSIGKLCFTTPTPLHYKLPFLQWRYLLAYRQSHGCGLCNRTKRLEWGSHFLKRAIALIAQLFQRFPEVNRIIFVVNPAGSRINQYDDRLYDPGDNKIGLVDQKVKELLKNITHRPFYQIQRWCLMMRQIALGQ